MALVLFVLILSQTNSAQTIGKIFSSEEANNLFGEVINSKSIETSKLQDFLDKTDHVLLFGIFDGKLIIAGDNRKVLYTEDYRLNAEDLLHTWSKDIIMELIEKGNQEITTVEERPEVMSLGNGLYIVEVGQKCPPFCDGDYTEK